MNTLKIQKNYSTDGINLHIPTLFLQHYQELFQYNNLEIPSEKQIQYYFLFLNTLYHSSVVQKNNNYIYYGSDFLIKLLGSQYPNIIRNLIKLEIINRTQYYQPRKKNYGYKFNSNFIDYLNGNSFSEVKVRNNFISRRLSKIYLFDKKKKDEKKKQQNLILKDPKYNHIAFHLKTFYDCYQKDEAINYLDTNFKKNSSQSAKQKALNYISKIQNNDTDIKVSEYGRIYTIFTNCKKELLRFYNQSNFKSPLIEIDMSASQPTLLCNFFDKYQVKCNTVIVDNKEYNWKQDCLNIYDRFQKLFNTTYNKKYNRNHLKTKLISYLNQSLWENERNNLHPIFLKYYPAVVTLLQEMKKETRNDKNKIIQNHCNFARELQGLESEIFMKNILFEFQKNHFILSKHDALIIQTKDFEVLKNEYIIPVFQKYGLSNYKFKIKELSTDKEVSENEISNLKIERTSTLDYKFVKDDYRMTVSA